MLVVFRAWLIGSHGLALGFPWMDLGIPCLGSLVLAAASSVPGWAVSVDFVPWDSKMTFGIPMLVVFRAWLIGSHGLALGFPWMALGIPCLGSLVLAAASSVPGWAVSRE
ncbi:hypothetical protein MA16_Dca022769 [Dendrobium catenatum]|uniref:Uncharacterized protein n=1 Tax=Dendrobium catenatum TaxID=906689 RepID=A0A2I0VV97_9ASPA|nr:hypothetical protein MA16_Dca022769 [Dendrobium catenatum]